MTRRKFATWVSNPASHVAVVGASGWVGAALADRALAAGLPPERLKVFVKTPRVLRIADRVLPGKAFTPNARLADGEWLIVHAGISGPEDKSPTGQAQARAVNDDLLASVLALADTAPVRRLVMVSSGIAGRVETCGPAKAAYAAMKRDHELAVADWGARRSAPVLTPRIFNLGGPYITWPRNYALGDFILSLSDGGRLAIGTGDPVVRDYTHVLEMASVLLEMAVDEAQDAAPFDIAGGEAVELGELARRVAGGLGVEAQIERPAPTGAASDDYVGEGARYQAALAGMGLGARSLDEIIADTAAYLRSP